MRILLLGFVLVLTACATQTHQPETGVEISEAQQEEWVVETQKWLRDAARLESVFFKILTKGIDYCEKQDHTAPYFGIQFWSNQRLHSSLQQVAQSKFNLGSEPQILIVVPTSPADSAGLRVNDKILEINGVGVQTVSDTQKKINEAKAALQPVSFTILRAGERQTLVASPVSGCKSQIALVNNDTIRTATDGETIQITRGLLHFAQSDEEIAAIISHQLAHNARKHHRTNKITGGVGGILIGSVGVAADTALAIVTGGIFPIGIFAGIGWDAGHSMAGGISDSQLQLADRDSLQLMATAGYETDNVIQFWQRVQDDASNNLNDLRNSHPFSQDRLKAMELAQEEKAKENLYSRLK